MSSLWSASLLLARIRNCRLPLVLMIRLICSTSRCSTSGTMISICSAPYARTVTSLRPPGLIRRPMAPTSFCIRSGLLLPFGQIEHEHRLAVDRARADFDQALVELLDRLGRLGGGRRTGEQDFQLPVGVEPGLELLPFGGAQLLVQLVEQLAAVGLLHLRFVDLVDQHDAAAQVDAQLGRPEQEVDRQRPQQRGQHEPDLEIVFGHPQPVGQQLAEHERTHDHGDDDRGVNAQRRRGLGLIGGLAQKQGN